MQNFLIEGPSFLFSQGQEKIGNIKEKGVTCMGKKTGSEQIEKFPLGKIYGFSFAFTLI